MYAIVRFTEENGAPGIICAHWMNGEENICHYPNVRTNEARDKLLRKLAEPAKNWITCPIKVLHKYSNFSDALLHLPNAEDTSNLDSDDDSTVKPRRSYKRSLKVVNEDEESDEEECQNEVIIDPYPVPKRMSPLESSCVTHSQPMLPSPNSSDKDPCQISAMSPSVTNDAAYAETRQNHSEDVVKRLPSSNQTMMNARIDQTMMNARIDQTMMNARILAWMTDISEQVRSLHGKLDLILTNKINAHNNQQSERIPASEDLEIMLNLPTTDDASFVALNKKVTEETNLRHFLVKVFISIGGKDMRCLIHNMLRRVVTDDVAELYSLRGKSTLKNSSKKAFLDTEVSKAIFSACRRVYKDATDEKIREAIGDWLNQAKVRKTRRLQRLEKSNGEEA